MGNKFSSKFHYFFSFSNTFGSLFSAKALDAEALSADGRACLLSTKLFYQLVPISVIILIMKINNKTQCVFLAASLNIMLAVLKKV